MGIEPLPTNSFPLNHLAGERSKKTVPKTIPWEKPKVARQRHHQQAGWFSSLAGIQVGGAAPTPVGTGPASPAEAGVGGTGGNGTIGHSCWAGEQTTL